MTKIRPRKLASIIYCIAWSSFSLQRAKTSNSQVHRLTERTVCTWVTSKLTYWYICDVCSIASCAKGYQALPLLTVHRCRAGGEPGNKAKGIPQKLIFLEANIVTMVTNVTQQWVGRPLDYKILGWQFQWYKPKLMLYRRMHCYMHRRHHVHTIQGGLGACSPRKVLKF